MYWMVEKEPNYFDRPISLLGIPERVNSITTQIMETR